MTQGAVKPSRYWLRPLVPLSALTAGLVSVGSVYFIYDLLAARYRPCEAIFRQTSVSLSTKLKFLKAEGELQIGRAPLTELDERAQLTALNLKTCCTVLDAGRLDPEQFLQCKSKAAAYTDRVENIVTIVQQASASQANVTALSRGSAAAAAPAPASATVDEQLEAARAVSRSFNREIVAVRRAQQLEALQALPPQHVTVAAQEREPNDDLLTTNVIELDTWVTAGIADGKDADFFTFKTLPQHRDRISIELENRSTTLEPRLELFDAAKSSLGSQHKTTKGADLAYTLVAPPETRYVFRVSNYYGESAGAYLVRVRATKAFDTYEPNDSILTARPASLGSTVSAAVMDGQDVDYFRFEVAQVGAAGSSERQLSIEVKNTSATLRPSVAVFDGSKTNLGGRHTTTAGGDLKYEAKIRADAAYYVRISDYYGEAPGSYELTVDLR